MSKHKIQDKKTMMIIEWNPLKFHLVESLSTDRTCNVKYYRDNIFVVMIPFHPDGDVRELLFRLDNAKYAHGQKISSFVDQKQPAVRQIPIILT
jgi:hypothetical protein